MKSLVRMLKCKSGNGSLLAIVIALSIVIISSAAYEYLRLKIIVGGVRDAVQSAVISVATDNYDEVYYSLREGYSGGYYMYGNGNWTESIDTGDVYARLDNTLGLIRQSGKHTKLSTDGIEYTLSDLAVRIENAPFAPSNYDAAKKYLADVTVNLEVPLSFGWSKLPPFKMTVRAKARYMPKF